MLKSSTTSSSAMLQSALPQMRDSKKKDIVSELCQTEDRYGSTSSSLHTSSDNSVCEPELEPAERAMPCAAPSHCGDYQQATVGTCTCDVSRSLPVDDNTVSHPHNENYVLRDLKEASGGARARAVARAFWITPPLTPVGRKTRTRCYLPRRLTLARVFRFFPSF
ncbi:hypothetical protein ACJJTC_014442 [Scirpophaga incertulas]